MLDCRCSLASDDCVHVLRIVLEVARLGPQRLLVDRWRNDFLEAVPHVLLPEEIHESIEYARSVGEKDWRAGAEDGCDEELLLVT